MLREVAKTIEQCIRRPADLAARYGGEEFQVVLPETELAGALLGIASADIVMTGGGPGRNPPPFSFTLENVVMA